MHLATASDCNWSTHQKASVCTLDRHLLAKSSLRPPCQPTVPTPGRQPQAGGVASPSGLRAGAQRRVLCGAVAAGGGIDTMHSAQLLAPVVPLRAPGDGRNCSAQHHGQLPVGAAAKPEVRGKPIVPG